MTKTPFAHTNTSLAIALHLAGATCIRIQNVYSKERLSRLGCLNPLDALKAGQLGKVVFYHRHTDGLEAVIQAFNAQSDEENDSELEADLSPVDVARFVCHVLRARKEITDAIRNPEMAFITDHELEAPADYTKWLVVEARARQKIKEAKAKDFKGNVCDILTHEEFEAITEPRSFNFPGFKMIKATASKDDREHLGL